MIWTSEKIAQLKGGWFLGKRGGDLVVHMNGEFSRGQIIIQVDALRLNENSKAPEPNAVQPPRAEGQRFGSSQWTEPMVVFLNKAWNEDGLSAARVSAAIFEEFGVRLSRNAVLGKLHRAGLANSDRPKAPSAPRSPRAPRQRRVRYTAEGFEIAPIEEAAPPPDCKRIPLIDLKDNTCRWPLGDPQAPDFAFCGVEGAENPKKPYCPYHAQLAVGEKSPRQRASAIDRAKRPVPTKPNSIF